MEASIFYYVVRPNEEKGRGLLVMSSGKTKNWDSLPDDYRLSYTSAEGEKDKWNLSHVLMGP